MFSCHSQTSVSVPGEWEPFPKDWCLTGSNAASDFWTLCSCRSRARGYLQHPAGAGSWHCKHRGQTEQCSPPAGGNGHRESPNSIVFTLYDRNNSVHWGFTTVRSFLTSVAKVSLPPTNFCSGYMVASNLIVQPVSTEAPNSFCGLTPKDLPHESEEFLVYNSMFISEYHLVFHILTAWIPPPSFNWTHPSSSFPVSNYCAMLLCTVKHKPGPPLELAMWIPLTLRKYFWDHLSKMRK